MTKKLIPVLGLLLTSLVLAPRIPGALAGESGSVTEPEAPSRPKAGTLNIYFIDVEGGASTLIVTPAGESILVDAGWPGFGDRDAKRIERAMQLAGVTEIDHMIATHYHVDHYGGIPAIAKAVPVKHFYDHGKMTSLAEDQNFAKLYSAYQSVTEGKSTTLKPGDTIALKSAPGRPSVKLLCVAGNGQVIGGRAEPENSDCAGAKLQDPDPSDNARSLGFILTFGGFRFLDLGDLTWNVEQLLVCPSNHLGHIDLYQVTHHGMNISNNPVLLRTVQPTVAVMDNGPHKGGHPDTVERLKAVRSLKALYQLHRNVESAAGQNSEAEFIANPEEKPDAAYMIMVSVDPVKHAFAVANERTGAINSFPFK
ncbi:MAG: ComEC/Rec2 family competence protein [Blastocatellia bacterium]